MREFSPPLNEAAGMTTSPLHHQCRCVQMAGCLVLLPLLCNFCPSCGERNAGSLQDNSKIGRGLLLLMSGGRSWDPARP
ncbi:hypothetical protein CEQ13_03355 [Klebsiella oxytoca]|nr:hypothetical protein CEQ13_03355 [Klebsiella oxytoca]